VENEEMPKFAMMIHFCFPCCSMVGQVMQTIDFDGLLATGNEVGDAAGAVAVVSPRFAWCVLCWESCFPAKKQLQLQNVTS